MRVGMLRSLLTILRAAGVTEFSAPDGKGTLTLKLAGGFAEPLPAAKSKPRAEPVLTAEDQLAKHLATPSAQATLKALGVPADLMAEELRGLA
jgi:hypothetical protein